MTADIRKLVADSIAIAAENAAPKADWTKIDTEIRHEGKQITLPADPGRMDYDDAIQTLERVRDQENQEFDVSETVKGAPWDTLVAVYRAMQDIYGVVLARGIQTFFGEIKPDFVTVITGHGDTDRLQVPAGMMNLPGVTSPVFVTMSPDGTIIHGTVRKRDRAILVEIANRARAILRESSIYKGKAIRLNVGDDGALGLTVQPEFLDLSSVRESDIIHTKFTEAQIRTSIFAPLKHTAACRANRVPLKRGILLEGKYGTGKSLTARVTAKVATENGWTFIMLNRSQGLKAAIEFAREYQPCVIFAEDIDRAADRSDEGVNDLVNLLDGLISKSMEMMVVLTTNFIENVDQSLLRPGRFDAVISIDAPDAETAERIIRTYAGPLLDPAADLGTVGTETAGMIPASIREVVERAKLSMLTEGRDCLTVDDLLVSAIGMQRHMALLAPKAPGLTPSQMFAKAFVELLGETGNGNSDVIEHLDDINHRLIESHRMTTARLGSIRDASMAAADSASKARDAASAAYDRATEVKKIVSR